MDELDGPFALVVGAIVAVASVASAGIVLFMAGFAFSLETAALAIMAALFIGGATGLLLFLRAKRYWKSFEANIGLRPATLDDAELLLAWRNDPVTRAMSKTPSEVALADHLKWLTSRLSREKPDLYIAVHDGNPAGTLRIDGDEVSYTIAPEFRGRGLATELLKLAFQRFGRLRAEIKPENLASIKAAEKAGHEVVLLPEAKKTYPDLSDKTFIKKLRGSVERVMYVQLLSEDLERLLDLAERGLEASRDGQ